MLSHASFQGNRATASIEDGGMTRLFFIVVLNVKVQSFVVKRMPYEMEPAFWLWLYGYTAIWPYGYMAISL